ncbi:methylated-DNA--[protein]-cysteine S-methyltransferase [Pinisolibacter sp.]|uniref:methylated-DNA--[protein]-cysteine S-methyltransferase n=1 Tax=Pinisolibacter sp. TaxID=2172024 RepID=UPI002FDD0B5E
MSTDGTHRFATAFGPVAVAWTARGLSRVRLLELEAGGDTVGERALPPVAAEAVRLLTAYFTGAAVDFSSLFLDHTGLSALDVAIYRELRRIPRGATVTYGELAARAGAPGAAQAVGGAMARNPWVIVVPCHRVLAAGGALGGFSAPGGVRTKRKLLRMEGVDLDGGAPMLPGLLPEE